MAPSQRVDVPNGAGDAAAARYRATRTRIAIACCFTLVLGAGLVPWLIRTIVPRARRYSTFAAEVSSGRLGGRLAARGTDELAELGRSLDDLVCATRASASIRAAMPSPSTPCR